TIGGGVCVDQLVDKVNSLREFYGNPNICAVVKLANTFMPTGYGGQQRPHFVYQRAVTYGDGGEVRTIEPPTAKQGPGDEIQFWPAMIRPLLDAAPDRGGTASGSSPQNHRPVSCRLFIGMSKPIRRSISKRAALSTTRVIRPPT